MTVLARLERPARQQLALLAVLPFVLLGASGWTQRALFAAPTPPKYALTVLAPLLMMAVVLARHPLLVLVAAAVVITPVAAFQISVQGASFTALTVVCVVAAIPVAIGLTPKVGRSAVGRALPWATILVLVPLARGAEPWASLTVALGAVTVGFLCARAVRLPGGIAVVLGSGLASLALQAVVAIWEYRSRNEFDLYSGAVAGRAGYFFDFQSQPRPSGTFPDPISLGTVLMLAVPIGLAAVHLLLRHRRRAVAAGVALLVAMIGVGLALTLSRMAALGALAGLLAVVAFAPRAQRPGVGRLAGALLVVLAAGALVLGGSALVERASSVSDPTAADVATADGDRDREAFWRVAADSGADHPVAGVGIGRLNELLVAQAPNAGRYTHAHSVYLQIFAECGLLGLAALLLMLVAVTRDLRRARRRAPVLTAGLAGAMVGLAVAAATDVVIIRNLPVAATIAPVIGLIVGLSGGRDDD